MSEFKEGDRVWVSGPPGWTHDEYLGERAGTVLVDHDYENGAGVVVALDNFDGGAHWWLSKYVHPLGEVEAPGTTPATTLKKGDSADELSDELREAYLDIDELQAIIDEQDAVIDSQDEYIEALEDTVRRLNAELGELDEDV